MRVLLSDGSGLTARQCATRLSADGHVVDVLSPDPMCLCRFTRSVDRVHRVSAYGEDPVRWLDAALDVYRFGRFDILFPTQEQVAVLSWARSQLETAGVGTAVPSFIALAAVQDKISASATLRRLGIPQPQSAIGVGDWTRFPAFVKDPIGTASGGVRRVTTPEELQRAATGKPVLVQASVAGPLIMCQSVFDHGSLVAFHANERTAEGADGGASHKTSVSMPDARRWFELLGGDLHWHGALSADLIFGDDGPMFIDVNPRLVEPQNAHFSGVDLVRAMTELATGGHPAPQPEGRAGVATHQLLLAVLGAAQHGGGRLGVVTEVLHAGRRNHDYLASSEELTPLARDPKALAPLAMAVAATVALPKTWLWFTSGSVSSYALTGEGWHQLLEIDPSSHHGDVRPEPGRTAARRGRRSSLRPVSRTAELMAVQRGLESARPPKTRLFEDPLAGSFVSLPWRIALHAARFPVVRHAIEATYDLVGGPGPRASAIARTKLIDDLVEQLIPSVDQIVILGAGYDTRPYRLDGLSTRAVFEVDHPSTQTVKRSVLRRTGTATTNVVFVPVDFEIDNLAEALLDAGYAPDRPALFLWEGVTQYLSGDAVDATLSVIRHLAAGESVLVFTYVDRAVIRGALNTFPEADRWLRGVDKRGEPWIFGITPTEAPAFLAERGFHLVDDLSTLQAGARYFGPFGRRDSGSGLYRVVLATFDLPSSGLDTFSPGDYEVPGDGSLA